jgi:hypothetical protein
VTVPELGLSAAANDVFLVSKESGFGKPLLAVDVTVADTEDTFSSQFRQLFRLEPVPAPGPADTTAAAAPKPAAQRTGLGGFGAGAQPASVRSPLAAAQELLFGFSENTIVPDGANRRGVLLFDVPPAGEWRLTCNGQELARVAAPRAAGPDDQWLLTRRPKYPLFDDGSPQGRVEKLIAEMTSRGAFRGVIRAGQQPAAIKTDFAGKAQPVEAIPPRLTAAGAAHWTKLLAGTEQDLWAALAELRLQSSTDKPWAAQLAPEAVLTQRSGSPADLAELARQWYAAHGVTAVPMQAALSEAGRQRLRAKLPLGDLPAQIPLLTTPQGTWAVPFALRGDAATPLLAAPPEAAKSSPTTTAITIAIVCQPKSSTAATKMGDLSSALGGSDANSEQRITLYSGTLSTAALSRDAFDVFFYETGGKEPEIRLQFAGPDGTVDGKTGIKTRDWKPVREIVEIRTPGQKVRVLERALGDAPLADTCHTIAIAAPDLPTAAATALAQAWAAQKTAETPNHRSIARWLGRSKIAKFLTTQTRWEEANAPALGVSLSRAASPRVLIATVCAGPDGKLRQSLDLRQSDAVVFGTPAACSSFRLMSGLTASAFEGSAAGGQSVLDFWKSPADFIVVTPKSRARFAQDLKTKGIPAAVCDRVKTGPEFLFFCKKPVELGGQPLYGWLAIDPTSYAITSTLSTGENGAVEEAIMELLPKTMDQTCRFFVGVDVSVWSVANFTLEGLPYDETLQEAEELAREIGEKLEWVANPKEYVEIAAKKFSLFGAEHAGGDLAAAAEEIKKFSDGFQVGVTEYFKHAHGGK